MALARHGMALGRPFVRATGISPEMHMASCRSGARGTVFLCFAFFWFQRFQRRHRSVPKAAAVRPRSVDRIGLGRWSARGEPLRGIESGPRSGRKGVQQLGTSLVASA
jgi:hypothetical protein